MELNEKSKINLLCQRTIESLKVRLGLISLLWCSPSLCEHPVWNTGSLNWIFKDQHMCNVWKAELKNQATQFLFLTAKKFYWNKETKLRALDHTQRENGKRKTWMHPYEQKTFKRKKKSASSVYKSYSILLILKLNNER